MDSPASPATSSSAIVLASAANNHEVPSKSFEYYLKNREAGDLRIHWQRINQLGEIEQKWFDVHQDEICRQSKSLAVKVQSEHQKQHRLPQWRRRHADNTIISLDFRKYQRHIIIHFFNFLYLGLFDLSEEEVEIAANEELPSSDRTMDYHLELRFPAPKILVNRIKNPLSPQSTASTVRPTPGPSSSPDSTISSSSTLLPSPSSIRRLPAKALITIANIFVMAAQQDVRALQDLAIEEYNNLLNSLTEPLERDDVEESLRVLHVGFQDTPRWLELKRPYARLIIESGYKKDGENRSRAEELAQLLKALESLQ